MNARHEMPEQDPETRRDNFDEVPLGYDEKTAMAEAARCLQCKNPVCVAACPVSVPIPQFIGHIKDGDFNAAARAVLSRNSLPAVCGRVCPQETQCEGACVLARKNCAVAIGALERFVADRLASGEGSAAPGIAPATGKKVAVIGSGPGSLTVAGDLIRRGHGVTVFEAFHQPGGVLVYGIPEFRLPEKVVESDLKMLTDMGVDIKCNVVVGKTLTIDQLLGQQGFDAVYIGAGAGLPLFLDIEGENLNGVYSANEYLTRSNLMKARLFPENATPVLRGRNVCVFGGGNVAMDALRTAIRMGAESATCVYRRGREEMPARQEEIRHAEEEGVKFLFLQAPARFIGDEKGRLCAVQLQEMRLGQPDQSGRRRPEPVPGAVTTLDCDMAVIAVGSGPNPVVGSATADLKVDSRGYIIADEHGRTSKEKVWAGGDIVTGAATVILAAGAGRKASDSMHEYLTSG
ncbi:MAG: NADPH-dependent glutamate synthase [Alphaproteobacteria bacterium]|nr:NADPH-dependent glutamate synthase [Alphaproteobacteria bacterium]